MPEFQVSCITKPNPENRHEHITHIGGNAGGGWTLSREEVVRRIEGKLEAFYVVDPKTNKRAYVGVVRPSDGRPPFLRTHADGDWNNNLLALPQCRK